MAVNGVTRPVTVPGGTISAAPVGPELGTGFDVYTLFAGFADGDVFEYGEWGALDVAEMLSRDGKARSVEQVLTLPLRSATYSIDPAKGDNGEAAWVNDTLTKPANGGGMSTPLRLLIGQMTSAVAYRKAFFEKVFRVDEATGRVVYDKVAFRPPATCELARDAVTGAFGGFRQIPWAPGGNVGRATPIRIPAARSFVYVHGQHRQPLSGVSDLDVAYWCYQTKQKIRFLWYQYLEGQALPKTIVKADDDATAQQAARKVATLKSAGVLGLSNRIGTDTLESSGKGADQFSAAISWLDSEASKSVLAGFTDLAGMATVGRGSYALSASQSEFFLQSRQAVLSEMGEALTSWLIADLVRYNFGPAAAVPTLTFGPVSEKDATMATSMLTSVMSASADAIVPREFVDELVARVAGLVGLDVDKIVEAMRERGDVASAAVTLKRGPQAARVAEVAARTGEAVRQLQQGIPGA